jgi:hypothetical protein
MQDVLRGESEPFREHPGTAFGRVAGALNVLGSDRTNIILRYLRRGVSLPNHVSRCSSIERVLPNSAKAEVQHVYAAKRAASVATGVENVSDSGMSMRSNPNHSMRVGGLAAPISDPDFSHTPVSRGENDAFIRLPARRAVNQLLNRAILSHGLKLSELTGVRP